MEKQQNLTLILTDQEVQLMIQGILELKARVAIGLLNKIDAQVKAQKAGEKGNVIELKNEKKK
jgi:hypothetical protein